MPSISQPRSADRIFLFAAVTAAIAAIFMVTVWAPLQLRAFTLATEAARADSPGSGNDAWLRVPFITADGVATSLTASNGQVRIVTMLYTHCPGICPLSVSTLQHLQGRLSASQQKKLSIVALSLDPQRDSLARLQEFRDDRGIDSGRWILGRASAEGARQIAAALGVSYRVLDDDSVDHQSVFVLLGRSGEVLARSSNTLSVDPRFLGALRAALDGNRR